MASVASVCYLVVDIVDEEEKKDKDAHAGYGCVPLNYTLVVGTNFGPGDCLPTRLWRLQETANQHWEWSNNMLVCKHTGKVLDAHGGQHRNAFRSVIMCNSHGGANQTWECDKDGYLRNGQCGDRVLSIRSKNLKSPTGALLGMSALDDKSATALRIRCVPVGDIHSQCTASGVELQVLHSLQESYLHMVNDQVDSDVIITTAGGAEIHAHKCVLRNRCEHFRLLLGSGMNETISSRIELPQIQQEDMLNVLRYLYAGVVPEDADTAGRMLAATDYFLIDQLKLACVTTLQEPGKGIDVDNLPRLYKLACDMKNAQLQKLCVEFAKANCDDVLNCDDLYGLPVVHLKSFMKAFNGCSSP